MPQTNNTSFDEMKHNTEIEAKLISHTNATDVEYNFFVKMDRITRPILVISLINQLKMTPYVARVRSVVRSWATVHTKLGLRYARAENGPQTNIQSLFDRVTLNLPGQVQSRFAPFVLSSLFVMVSVSLACVKEVYFVNPL